MGAERVRGDDAPRRRRGFPRNKSSDEFCALLARSPAKGGRIRPSHSRSEWLGGRDLNPDSQIQSLESYRWTTPQRTQDRGLCVSHHFGSNRGADLYCPARLRKNAARSSGLPLP